MANGGILSHQAALEMTKKIFEARGLPPEEAYQVASALVWANLRGIDSHGIIRIPGYMMRLEKGIVNPRPKMRIVKETLAAMVIDADHGHGQVAITFGMKKAIEKAKKASIGWVLVRKTKHSGAVGYYTRMAANAGMAGLYMGASSPNMAYHGTKAGGVSTSPISMSVPRDGGKTISLDMATAIAGVGKLMEHKALNEPLGEGWALDDDGNPTTDPQVANLPRPLGGPKGSGLSLMFECMSSLMVGSAILEPWLSGVNQKHHQNAVVAAIDISAFVDLSVYCNQSEGLAKAIKGLPKAEGVDEVLIPGERSDAVYEKRLRDGFFVPATIWSATVEIAEKYNVPVPKLA